MFLSHHNFTLHRAQMVSCPKKSSAALSVIVAIRTCSCDTWDTLPARLLAHASEHVHAACHDPCLFARTQLDLQPGIPSTNAVSPPEHAASLCHPDSPQCLSCCLTNLGGAFTGTIKNRHCHRGHVSFRHQNIESQLRISSEYMLIWTEPMGSEKDVSG